MRVKASASGINVGKRGEVALIGVFLAFILAVGLLERMVPLDFLVPGARLGLSNVVVLTSVYLFRFRVTLLLVILKCALLSMLAGGPASLIYSVSGSLLSLAAMQLLVRCLPGRIGPIGVSAAGAACHSAGQVLAACFVLENMGMLAYLPPLLLISLVSGVLVGVIVQQTVPRLRALERAGMRR
ncbi:MAG: Gx transporter family protein [Clostridiales Family XIII bacterium]|jgi:heptaprenyl diphosphate synthase|nr:Gx transporter family protein [Clostridiales Family XIII bacterium]